MSKGNGKAIDGAFAKVMSLDEKVDAMLAALSEIREYVESVPVMAEQIEALSEGHDDIIEKLSNLGLDNPGFGISDYDS